jgi:hypothetical protein
MFFLCDVAAAMRPESCQMEYCVLTIARRFGFQDPAQTHETRRGRRIHVGREVRT